MHSSRLVTRFWALALGLAANGCSYDWDSLRPRELPYEDVTPPDTSADAPIDLLPPEDARDAAIDLLTPPDITARPDVIDARDVTDASVPRDALDASLDRIDVMDVIDVIDVGGDATIDRVVVAEVGVDAAIDRPFEAAIEVGVDVGPDVGPDAPACMGPPATCPCAPTNNAGYCTVGTICSTAGACAAIPLPGALVISEIMNDPMYVADDVGEWFEVFNPGRAPVDLRTLRASNSRSVLFTITGTSPVLLGAGAYAVFARSTNPMVNGGVSPLFVYGVGSTSGTLSLGNTSIDAVILDLGTTTTEIDVVRYEFTSVPGWPRTSGRSKSLAPGALNAIANDNPLNWCNAPNRWSLDGDFGSPSLANPLCP